MSAEEVTVKLLKQKICKMCEFDKEGRWSESQVRMAEVRKRSCGKMSISVRPVKSENITLLKSFLKNVVSLGALCSSWIQILVVILAVTPTIL